MTRLVGILIFSWGVFISNLVSAVDSPIQGSMRVNLKIQHGYGLQAPPDQSIELLRVHLDKAQRRHLVERHTNSLQRVLRATESELPDSIHLGMNGTPVLNQGPHGTCATFATTAALDAAIGQGDYISQVCQLVLGNYLQRTEGSPSGWDGSTGHFVLSVIERNGFIGMTKQNMQGCGGIRVYPVNSREKPKNELSISEFSKMSESLSTHHVHSESLLTVYDVINGNTDTEKAVMTIKSHLAKGHRVALGSILAATEQGVVGAVGTYSAMFDTWVPTPSILKEFETEKDSAGHEMVITGYDDNAVAYDYLGQPHQGLFTLRNSWGKGAGDQGDFYMSYDYVRHFILESSAIVHDNGNV